MRIRILNHRDLGNAFAKEKSKRVLFVIVLLFALFSSVLIYFMAAKFNSDTSLSLNASQFLKGHISLEPNLDLPVGDISIYDSKYYLYFGPFGWIVLLPFVALFGKDFPQSLVGIATLVVSFYAVYSHSRIFKFNKIDSLWLALFFVFSTVLFSTSIINITSYLVEALGVPLVLLSFLEYFSKKRRPLLIGLFLGLAIMSRLLLILVVVFFFVEFIKKRFSKKEFVTFLIPVVLACMLLGAYNYMRFDSVFETGYSHHIGDPYPLSMNTDGYGSYSLMHLPANLYSFFIKPPEPILYFKDGFVFKFPYLKADPWGMALWFTSPLFLLLFRFRKNKYTMPALITTICIAIPIFTYYSVGFAQFGYRYALDFLPFLFLLLIPSLQPKLSKTAIALIIIGVLFNCLYITSLWGVYPHFGIN